MITGQRKKMLYVSTTVTKIGHFRIFKIHTSEVVWYETQEMASLRFGMNHSFLFFYTTQPRSQVWIFIVRNWPFLFSHCSCLQDSSCKLGLVILVSVCNKAQSIVTRTAQNYPVRPRVREVNKWFQERIKGTEKSSPIHILFHRRHQDTPSSLGNETGSKTFSFCSSYLVSSWCFSNSKQLSKDFCFEKKFKTYFEMCVPRAKFFDIIFGFWIFTRSMLENTLYFLVIKKQYTCFLFEKKKKKCFVVLPLLFPDHDHHILFATFLHHDHYLTPFVFFSSSLSSTNASAPVEWEFLCNLPCGDHGYILFKIFVRKKNSRVECPVTSRNINRLETHSSQDVVARYNNSVATPSIFESLIFEQIDLYGKTIITHVLHID